MPNPLDPTPEPAHEFSALWASVKSTVYLHCCRQTNHGKPISRDDAKDMMQEIAIKAWAGFPKWKRESSFKTWIFTITNRVVSDYFNREKKRDGLIAVLAFDEAQKEKDSVLFEQNGAFLENEALVRYLLAAVLRTNWPKTNKTYLDELDQAIIRTKLDNPDMSTVELAAYLGISPTNYYVRYCRALVEIRTYCYQYRPELFGGIPVIRNRFLSLISRRPPGLSPLETAVFEALILEKRFDTRPNGWQDALRSACAKMIFK